MFHAAILKDLPLKIVADSFLKIFALIWLLGAR